MSLFQHPHLTRGIVQTAQGAFAISRGRVEMPDDLGESLGWRPVDRPDEQSTNGTVAFTGNDHLRRKEVQHETD
jgi:hypothetical protein